MQYLCTVGTVLIAGVLIVLGMAGMLNPQWNVTPKQCIDLLMFGAVCFYIFAPIFLILETLAGRRR